MRLDTATLGFSGRKGRADIFWGREVSMGLFSPSELEKIFDTLDRGERLFSGIIWRGMWIVLAISLFYHKLISLFELTAHIRKITC